MPNSGTSSPQRRCPRSGPRKQPSQGGLASTGRCSINTPSATTCFAARVEAAAPSRPSSQPTKRPKKGSSLWACAFPAASWCCFDRRVQKVLFDWAVKNGEDRDWLNSLVHAGMNSVVQHARSHRDRLSCAVLLTTLARTRPPLAIVDEHAPGLRARRRQRLNAYIASSAAKPWLPPSPKVDCHHWWSAHPMRLFASDLACPTRLSHEPGGLCLAPRAPCTAILGGCLRSASTCSRRRKG